jgi:hypothetical protein
MPSIDYDRELNLSSSSKVTQGIQCCSNRSTGKQHVIDQDDYFSGEISRDVRRRFWEYRSKSDVISIKRHVERADWRCASFNFEKVFAEPLSYRDATGLEPNQDDIFEATISLNDFVRHSKNGTAEIVCIQNVRMRHKYGPQGARMSSLSISHFLLLTVRASQNPFDDDRNEYSRDSPQRAGERSALEADSVLSERSCGVLSEENSNECKHRGAEGYPHEEDP